MLLPLTLTQSYVENIRTEEQLSISEEKDVELMNMGTPKRGEGDSILRYYNVDTETQMVQQNPRVMIMNQGPYLS